MIDGLLTTSLFLTSTLYTCMLDHLRRRQRPEDMLPIPDGTWLEVIVGVAICLFFGTLGAKNHKKDGIIWTIGAFWLAFFVGGLPVVCWQLTGVYTRWRKVLMTQRRGPSYDPTETVATEQ